MNDFCVFILSHARYDRVFTYNTLRKLNYTGKIFIVIDKTDKQIDNYKAKYGNDVLVFDKEEIAKTFDCGDNFQEKRAVVYARNACFELAKFAGFTYFMQLDDDYTDFRYSFDDKMNYVTNKYIKNLNAIFEIMLNFYKSTSFTAISMAQGGDFIGGGESSMSMYFKAGQIHRRKCMNSFLCSTDRQFNFIGRINEDVNTYVNLGNKGELFLTIPQLRLEQKTTQTNAGGLTDIYLNFGTYVKSFYSVMYNPSCVNVRLMGGSRQRLHHNILWDVAVPKIMNEKYKKYSFESESKPQQQSIL